MQRISVGVLFAIAGALALWLALGSGEEDDQGARVGVLRSTAQAGSSAGAEAATPGTTGGERERRVGPEQSVGDVKFVDITETLVRLQAEQIALEASFSTLAQARNLTLLNFL